MSIEQVMLAMPSPRAFAEMLGIKVSRGGRVDRFRVCCPWHNEKNPSCDITVKAGRIVAHCHSCHNGGDAISLAAAVWGMDERRQPREVDHAADLADRMECLADQWLVGRDVKATERDEAAMAAATPGQWERARAILDMRTERERYLRERESETDAKRNDELEAMADDVLRAAARRETAALKALAAVPDARDLADEAAEREAIQSEWPSESTNLRHTR
jgi:hypothetical protein